MSQSHHSGIETRLFMLLLLQPQLLSQSHHSGIETATFPPSRSSLTECRNRTIVGLKHISSHASLERKHSRNRTIVGLTPLPPCEGGYREHPPCRGVTGGPRNRTIVGLKGVSIRWVVADGGESQSYHNGVETIEVKKVLVPYQPG